MQFCLKCITSPSYMQSVLIFRQHCPRLLLDAFYHPITSPADDLTATQVNSSRMARDVDSRCCRSLEADLPCLKQKQKPGADGVYEHHMLLQRECVHSVRTALATFWWSRQLQTHSFGTDRNYALGQGQL